jgi:hypothetical protein
LFSVYAIENDFLLPQRVLIVLDIDLMVVLAVRGRVEVLQIPYSMVMHVKTFQVRKFLGEEV